MNPLTLLMAFEPGLVVVAGVQASLAPRSRQDERRFREKQAACIGLLEGCHHAAVESTGKAAMTFAPWQMRCDLVAAEAVRRAIERTAPTNDEQAARTVAHVQLTAAFRADPGNATQPDPRARDGRRSPMSCSCRKLAGIWKAGCPHHVGRPGLSEIKEPNDVGEVAARRGVEPLLPG